VGDKENAPSSRNRGTSVSVPQYVKMHILERYIADVTSTVMLPIGEAHWSSGRTMVMPNALIILFLMLRL
jgi:hypothetical protein